MVCPHTRARGYNLQLTPAHVATLVLLFCNSFISIDRAHCVTFYPKVNELYITSW